MTVSLIAAVAKNRVIGRSGKIPWRLPADMAYFKRVTMGHALIMGRKTLESVGRPLPGRTNIVVTRNPAYARSGVIVARSAEEALERARAAAGADAEVFVIGGAEVYALFFAVADRLYITEIEADFPGDERFPVINEDEWRRTRSSPSTPDGVNPIPFNFSLYERKRS
jgi:dihydrofolate reductase